MEDALTLLGQSAGTNAVFCSHGDIVPAVLDALAQQDALELPKNYDCAKGSAWVIEEKDGKAVTAKYLAAPD